MCPPNPVNDGNLNDADITPLRFREVIARSGIITPDQLEIALDYQAKTHKFLGQIIAEHKFVGAREIYTLLGAHIQFPFIGLEETPLDPYCFKILTREEIVAWQSIIFYREGHTFRAAMADPENLILQDKIMGRIEGVFGQGQKVQFYLADPRTIEKALFNCNESESSTKPGPIDAVGYIDELLQESVQLGVSDIHLFPLEHGAEIKLRLDGVLKSYRTISDTDLPFLINRLKVLAGLNIPEQRLPQSGGFCKTSAGHDVDYRVSVHRTILGESLVIRVLDKSKRLLNLVEMGFSGHQVSQLTWAAHQKSGLIICCGPTGAGKSSTLYALVNQLNHDELNIMTLEDPVEFKISSIRQTEIKTGGMNFSEGIRSMLRHDPDVMLIGEIRDAETAQAAIRASLTGHLVLTTLHAPSLEGIFSRLTELGIPPSQISSQLLCGVNQRLVRRICEVCQGAMCKNCHHTGYKGRTVIAEMIVGEKGENMRDYSRTSPTNSLWDEGRILMAQGLTDEKELKRVLGEGAIRGKVETQGV